MNDVKANTTSAERVKQLITENGWTQKRLADAIGYTEQQVNRICRGKCKLEERPARAIAGVFAPVRFQWVMGLDNFKTSAELLAAEFDGERKLIDTRCRAFIALATLAGYEISPHSVPYTISKDGNEVGELTNKKLKQLALDVQELVELRVKSYLREEE